MKVSSATGLVLTLHPHGPQSIEAAMVNLAQDFTFANNYPLIDKKGYFGERMETSPAAGRYIECRLGKIADILLFDDMNQVDMVPNFDETVMEPVSMLPKLPIMLLNGAEGIGTGFSSSIPSFHHRDICDSIVQFLETGKPKKLRPFAHNYTEKIQVEKNKFVFPMRIEEKAGKFYITELPRGYDAVKIYRHLNKLMDADFIKDYIDSSVDNEINIELIFKRGASPTMEEVMKKVYVQSSQTPNYTLISEGGVRIFDHPEEIIQLFAEQRLKVVKRRYELLSEDYERRIRQHNEIIKFIKQKEYVVATRSKNRKSFIEHLAKKKYTFAEYLADMSIYRMTKDEVAKRQLLVKEETAKLKEFQKIAGSPKLVQKKLIEELGEVREKLDLWLRDREKERKDLRKKLEKKGSRTRKK